MHLQIVLWVPVFEAEPISPPMKSVTVLPVRVLEVIVCTVCVVRSLRTDPNVADAETKPWQFRLNTVAIEPEVVVTAQVTGDLEAVETRRDKWRDFRRGGARTTATDALVSGENQPGPAALRPIAALVVVAVSQPRVAKFNEIVRIPN